MIKVKYVKGLGDEAVVNFRGHVVRFKKGQVQFLTKEDADQLLDTEYFVKATDEDKDKEVEKVVEVTVPSSVEGEEDVELLLPKYNEAVEAFKGDK